MFHTVISNPIISKILFVLDIGLVATLIYYIYKSVQHTRAMPVLKGVIFIVILTLVSRWFNLVTVNMILEKISAILVIAVIILFPYEVRRGFYTLGRTKFLGAFFKLQKKNITNIIEAVRIMSKKKTGSLIILERQDEISSIISSGVFIDSNISTELILSIFNKRSPLHDGAVVIRRDRILAATCFIPNLTNKPNVSSKYGTRHRAAMGLSEQTDSFIITISEETRSIGVAFDGDFFPRLTIIKLENLLSNIMEINTTEKKNEEKKKT